MPDYEINELAKEESWRMFRIIGELVEGFDTLTGIEPAVTVYGSARLKEATSSIPRPRKSPTAWGNWAFPS